MKHFNSPFKHAQNGFTLLEMVVVIVLVGFLGLIILDRAWKFRVYAEEAAVTSIIGNIRSALGLEVAKLAVRGKIKNIANLHNTNPMNLMAQTPDNYIGEVDDTSNVEGKGIWYFNKSDHTLNYTVSYTDNFKSNVNGIKRTRHQLKIVYTDNNKNSRFDAGIDDINGLDLVAKEPYRWIVEK
ncbi:MAG: type II secretion system GspH family protein [Gammaproteobacteria bacterium]|nr:type II secretion system GspH family protein [Gammaproteobacteria bacterium]MCW8986710.1 type II secretion system GspH family protein [Gammaproteobacteria bacterium]MCW9032512.1 type II secretion system GspH family protein [Gammaproteobacteria bacterium]